MLANRPSPPPASCINQYNSCGCDTINTLLEYRTLRTSRETRPRRAFFLGFLRTFFPVVGGIGSGRSDTARSVVGSVPAEMPSSVTSRRRCVFTRARGRAAEEPLIRCCVSSSKNPFRPQCGPRAAHAKLFRTAAPRRRLRRFPFVFLPLAHIRPHTHARVIRSDCTLTLGRHYTGAWKRTYLYIRIPTLAWRYASSLQQNDERGKTKTAYKSACAF